MSFAPVPSVPLPFARRFAVRALLVAAVVLVATFSTSDPYLEGLGLCGHGGCPEASQSSHIAHSGSSGACLAAVLVAAGVAGPAFFAGLGLGRATRQQRPSEAYLPPDPPPPRVSLALPSH